MLQLLLTCVCACCFAQETAYVDSLKKLIASGKTDINTIHAYYHLAVNAGYSSGFDSALHYSRRGLELARQINYERGIVSFLIIDAFVQRQLGKFSESFKTTLEALKTSEDANLRIGVFRCYNEFYALYERTFNYDQALRYTYKISNEFADLINDTTRLTNISLIGEDLVPMHYIKLGRLAWLYKRTNKLDSALKYSQLAYEYGYRLYGTSADYTSLYLVGSTQYRLGNHSLALPYLQKSLALAESTDDYSIYHEAALDLSRLYKDIKQDDSALYYGNKAFAFAKQWNIKRSQMESSAFLAELHKGKDNAASAMYYSISSALRDSLFSEEKSQLLNQQIFAEILRQNEIDAEQERARKERINNIQIAAIGIGIILLVITFLLLSRTIIVNERIISFLGIVVLLITFEFINLIIHPYISEFTHHSPIWMLLALVGIAAILAPIHHRLRKWIDLKLVEKNRKIRLSAAKKTIEILEGKNVDSQ